MLIMICVWSSCNQACIVIGSDPPAAYREHADICMEPTAMTVCQILMQKQYQASQVNGQVLIEPRYMPSQYLSSAGIPVPVIIITLSISLCGFKQHEASGGTECRYLCDEALDTEALREALSLRVDGAEEVKKEMREDIAEDKRKLKVSQIHCTNEIRLQSNCRFNSTGHRKQLYVIKTPL